jgi:hypothetical protein
VLVDQVFWIRITSASVLFEFDGQSFSLPYLPLFLLLSFSTSDAQGSMYFGQVSGATSDEFLPPNKILFLQNLPEDATEQSLTALFQQYVIHGFFYLFSDPFN